MDMRKEVLRQTGIVLLGEAVGVAAMIGVFALLGQYSSRVLLGGIIGGLVTAGNFLAMAIAVNIAADKAQAQNVKGGETTIRISYLARTVAMAVILFAFAKSGLCNVIALVVPLIFMRPTLMIAEFFRRKPGDKSV